MARICVLTQDPALGGGVLTKLEAFLQFATTREHACDLYFPVGKTYPALVIERLRDEYRIDHVYPASVPQKLPHFLSSTLFARHCKLRSSYDAYQLVAGSLYQGLLFARQSRPFGAWIAGTHLADRKATPCTKLRHYILYNPLSDELVRRQEVASGEAAKLILAVSSNSVREICRDLRIAEDKVRVLPVPVDLDQLRPGQPRTEPSRYILSVGRLDRRKDFQTLLRAFQEVAVSMDGVQLHIVGDGRERKNLERMAIELGIQDRVEFLGQVGNRELIDEYLSASCFALASRQEGLGIVFLEAMASGLPVVATDSGGSADPIVHGDTGYLVPVGDWKGLAGHMTQLFRDPDVLVKLGQAGRERALSTYSFDRIFGELDKAYAEVFDI